MTTSGRRPGAADRPRWAMLPTPSRPRVSPLEAPRLRVLLLVPAAGAQLGNVVRDPPVERQDQRRWSARPRRSSSCPDSSTRRCRGARPPPRRSCCSPRRPAPPGRARPASSISAVTLVLRTTRTSARVSAIAPVSASSFRSGCVHHLAAGGPQALDPALLEFVRDQHLHLMPSVRMSGRRPRRRSDQVRRAGRPRSLGSNQVDLGGMIPPASAIAINSSMVTGNRRTPPPPARCRPACSSAPVPRIPPTKSIRLSVRTSPMPEERRQHRPAAGSTSSAIGGAGPAAPRRQLEACTSGRRGTSRTWPALRRRAQPAGRHSLAASARNASGERPPDPSRRGCRAGSASGHGGRPRRGRVRTSPRRRPPRSACARRAALAARWWPSAM